jgi:hypothetical protein
MYLIAERWYANNNINSLHFKTWGKMLEPNYKLSGFNHPQNPNTDV